MWNRLEFLSWTSRCLSPDSPGWINCAITYRSHDKQVFKPSLTLVTSPRWWESARRGRERCIRFNLPLFTCSPGRGDLVGQGSDSSAMLTTFFGIGHLLWLRNIFIFFQNIFRWHLWGTWCSLTRIRLPHHCMMSSLSNHFHSSGEI